MIISASYKTDIPAFYGRWFLNRLETGYCKMKNPYNHRQVRWVSLKPEDLDGFVFWTKNLGSFWDSLNAVNQLDLPFVVQYSLTSYPKELEHSVVDAKRSIEQMKKLAHEYDPLTVVWRYDPILFTSITPFPFHCRNFEHLAQKLEGSTDEVVISFAQFYHKTLRNLNWAARNFDFCWEDPPDDLKLKLVSKLAQMAQEHGMKLKVCSQRKYLVPGVEAASCVDARRLSEIGGKTIRARRKGNRPDCGCYASIDIGEYDTCPHGCIYCYAVRNRNLALRRYKEHDPEGEFLFSPYGQKVETGTQMTLF
jgi:hypothetical protein